ncbi:MULTISPECIES: spike base protein, RCAP_Rcc01079 family [Sphingomonas]|jgi:hypothetical protein|uniref:Uncharacterized protein n=1 Tax=Sphingomonas yabuuchiae TaxID=172044 RepID=A0AA40ZYN0_9SPHN|nr:MULTISPECIES: hypothetical protein [Sphingomonas]KQO51421.1 hypothetical protein ASF14_07945 [Sphingomonas sp. Leaf257]MBB4611535.1 hypothetical protein [Sphingomonas yabuuchiae]MBN3557469.1 hypothetical protein [Sphingomonas yabuuchiae]
MPQDRYGSNADTVTAPANRSLNVVPHDTNELGFLPKGIMVGTAGTIVGRLRDDVADRTYKVWVGYHPMRFKLIKATGTTAADIVALD